MKNEKMGYNKEKRSVILFLLVLILIVLVLISSCSNDYYKDSYIQASHTNTEYSYSSNQITINDVYCNKMQGSSMNPSIFEGNVVCFKEYTNQELKQGNIIDYFTLEMEKVHRIIGLQSDLIIVQGDNTYVQEKINYSDVKGILVVTIYE